MCVIKPIKRFIESLCFDVTGLHKLGLESSACLTGHPLRSYFKFYLRLFIEILISTFIDIR